MRTVILFFAFVFSGLAPIFAQGNGFLEELRSPRWLLYQEAQDRPGYYAAWEGKSSWVALRLMMRSGNDSELALSEEQSGKFDYLRKDNELAAEWFRKKMTEKDETLLKAQEKNDRAYRKIDPDLGNLSPELKKEFLDSYREMISLWHDEMQSDISATLSEDQMNKLRAVELQILPEIGMPNPEMFAPLGLSEEQQEQMREIKEKMQPIFEAQLNDAMAARKEYLSLMVENLAEAMKNDEDGVMGNLNKAMMEAAEKASADEKLVEKFKQNALRGSKFANKLKERLMNVLTDEQLDAMQKILDQTPESLKKMLAESKSEREKAEKEKTYAPGPDSWRPGDGSPEEFKQRRKKGEVFPDE